MKFEKSVEPFRYSIKNRSMDSFSMVWKESGFGFDVVRFMLIAKIKGKWIDFVSKIDRFFGWWCA